MTSQRVEQKDRRFFFSTINDWIQAREGVRWPVRVVPLQLNDCAGVTFAPAFFCFIRLTRGVSMERHAAVNPQPVFARFIDL